MVRRRQTAKADLKIRLKEPMRARIERAASKRGVSMNAEMVDRLERSFGQDDSFGGPQWRQTAHLMLSAFAIAGQRRADSKRFVGDWMTDADCYLAAVCGVIEGLTIGAHRGALDRDYVGAVIESLKGRLATRLVNKAGEQK